MVVFSYSNNAAVQSSLLYRMIHPITPLTLTCSFVQVTWKLVEWRIYTTTDLEISGRLVLQVSISIKTKGADIPRTE